MGTASLLLGIRGLVAIGVGLPLMMPPVFFGGAGASVAALIIGFIGRETGGPAKAGLALGLLSVLGLGGVIFLVMGSSEVQVSQPKTETKAVPPPPSLPAAQRVPGSACRSYTRNRSRDLVWIPVRLGERVLGRAGRAAPRRSSAGAGPPRPVARAPTPAGVLVAEADVLQGLPPRVAADVVAARDPRVHARQAEHYAAQKERDTFRRLIWGGPTLGIDYNYRRRSILAGAFQGGPSSSGLSASWIQTHQVTDMGKSYGSN